MLIHLLSNVNSAPELLWSSLVLKGKLFLRIFHTIVEMLLHCSLCWFIFFSSAWAWFYRSYAPLSFLITAYYHFLSHNYCPVSDKQLSHLFNISNRLVSELKNRTEPILGERKTNLTIVATMSSTPREDLIFRKRKLRETQASRDKNQVETPFRRIQVQTYVSCFPKWTENLSDHQLYFQGQHVVVFRVLFLFYNTKLKLLFCSLQLS